MRDGIEVALSPLEFRLLERLIANAGRVLLSDDLLQSVWGQGYEGADESLRTAVARLRRKIESDPDRPRHHPDGSWSRLQLSTPNDTSITEWLGCSVQRSCCGHARVAKWSYRGRGTKGSRELVPDRLRL